VEENEKHKTKKTNMMMKLFKYEKINRCAQHFRSVSESSSYANNIILSRTFREVLSGSCDKQEYLYASNPRLDWPPIVMRVVSSHETEN
jgi:hypothetical protein